MRHSWIVLAAWATAAVPLGCGDNSSAGNTPQPATVYVAKVKNLLVGLPPTDAEIAAVTADPSALPGLIDGWTTLPEYPQKMLGFFELAFQQTQITTNDLDGLVPPNGEGPGRALPLLAANARESFARTMLQLVADDRPLTDGFTTRQLMMTPALMELYAFLDARTVDDSATVSDAFAQANPSLPIVLEAKGGAIAIDDTVTVGGPSYMHWYVPDIATQQYPDPTCDGVDPITIRANALFLHELLYGAIPPHAGAGSATTNCPIRQAMSAADGQFDPTDFTSWKLVTIRPPNPGEPRTPFYDLPALRSASELVLTTPRIGYFTTPAFFANWPTNQSNQMRATVNQALIVATGAQIDGSDPTTPKTTPGLDAEHAAPGTACFGCHQLLDPTRSILASTYSWFYSPQTDPTLIAQPGLFAFEGVVAPMKTIGDFAELLASHPLVAQAWVEKLCYYANSAPCDPTDPELQRIVADFAAGFSWTALVRELMSSPLTTHAARSAASGDDDVIAVTRRGHLCAALDARLGLINICGQNAVVSQIAGGMPSDGYGRGATAPVLPNQPTLFYRAGLENICAAVAEVVIDPIGSSGQPTASHWSSEEPDPAIADFVAIMMGLTADDPRAAPATQALRDHFTTASHGASASDALRSTFVVACLSPSFSGIGM